jgi:hypothetical protein
MEDYQQQWMLLMDNNDNDKDRSRWDSESSIHQQRCYVSIIVAARGRH